MPKDFSLDRRYTAAEVRDEWRGRPDIFDAAAKSLSIDGEEHTASGQRWLTALQEAIDADDWQELQARIRHMTADLPEELKSLGARVVRWISIYDELTGEEAGEAGRAIDQLAHSEASHTSEPFFDQYDQTFAHLNEYADLAARESKMHLVWRLIERAAEEPLTVPQVLEVLFKDATNVGTSRQVNAA